MREGLEVAHEPPRTLPGLQDKEEAEQKAIDAERLAKPPAAQGFLSMSRSLALDDMVCANTPQATSAAPPRTANQLF